MDDNPDTRNQGVQQSPVTPATDGLTALPEGTNGQAAIAGPSALPQITDPVINPVTPINPQRVQSGEFTPPPAQGPTDGATQSEVSGLRNRSLPRPRRVPPALPPSAPRPADPLRGRIIRHMDEQKEINSQLLAAIHQLTAAKTRSHQTRASSQRSSRKTEPKGVQNEVARELQLPASVRKDVNDNMDTRSQNGDSDQVKSQKTRSSTHASGSDLSAFHDSVP